MAWRRIARNADRIGLLLVALSLTVPGAARAVTIWTGPTISFEKGNFVDVNLPENQDRITPNVWITRGNTQGIFNIKIESGYSSVSPQDTMWAFGFAGLNEGEAITAANYENLEFRTWAESTGFSPPSMIGQPGVVHLISEDIYFDIMFTSWQIGGGGGFAYFRSTAPPPPIPLLPGAPGLGGAALLFGAASLWASRARFWPANSCSRAARAGVAN